MAQLVKRPTLDLDRLRSGFVSLSPASGSVLTEWSPLGDSLSLPLSVSLPRSHCLSLKRNKHKKNTISKFILTKAKRA